MVENQVFRKATRGYNKDDVNKFIASLNSEILESQKRYDKLASDSNAKSEKDYYIIMELREKITALEALKEQNESLEAENAALKNQLEELKSSKNEEAARNNQEYDNLCSKAGEILVIASNTADSILKKASEEADKIIGSATAKKDSMIKNITDTASTAADGLGDYIRGAVDACIEKINASIQSVDFLKDVPSEEIPVMSYTEKNNIANSDNQ